MGDLDLNVNHYSINELEQIIQVKKPYNFHNIQYKSMILKKKIFDINSLSSEKKMQIHIFIKDIIDTLERFHIAENVKILMKQQRKIDDKLTLILSKLDD